MLGALATGVRASAASLVSLARLQSITGADDPVIRIARALYGVVGCDLETACFPIGISLAELELRDEHSHSANNCQATDRIEPSAVKHNNCARASSRRLNGCVRTFETGSRESEEIIR
jgi:hypothetical protein